LPHAEPLPDFDPEKPLEMAISIDRSIRKMRAQAVDPRFDRTRSLQERAQYMPEAPAARMRESSDDVARRATTDVAWIPYMSRKEKLESWIEPNTQDAGDKRTLYKQMSKLERG
jgi:hypothetical protein